MSEAKHQELVAAHVMFPDTRADLQLKSAGIASFVSTFARARPHPQDLTAQPAHSGMAKDWPVGRGCYQSADSGFIIWFGEEDQIRIMCMARGVVLNPAFDLVKVHG